MDLRHLPIIDWNRAIHLTGNKKEFAVEILDILIQQLPNDLSEINKVYESKNLYELLRLVHKLHGALCYTGLPRVKSLISRLETELKSNIMDNLASLLEQLNAEVRLLLERYPLLQT
jgi:two-component system sensor histidine kinase BarA